VFLSECVKDKFFSKAGWINPRLHPWRFAAAVGLLVGFCLAIAQLQEGLPPSLAIGPLVTGIFFSGEFFAILIGFAVFGVFLGIRPLTKNHPYPNSHGLGKNQPGGFVRPATFPKNG
jgi:hypothetical protein